MNTVQPERILQRADELGIRLWADGDKIKYRALKGVVPPRMVEVLKANKEALLVYFSTREEVVSSNPEQEEQFCYACLNEDRETPAHFVGPEDLMYCQRHYNALPSQVHEADMERIAEIYGGRLPFIRTARIEPRCTLAEHVQQMQTQKERTPEDYWTETRRKLMQQGYYEQVARDEEHFRQQVIHPRAYPAPFPAYAQVTIDEMKTVQVVGMWHPTEHRLMMESEL